MRPGLEPLPSGGQRANARFDSVRDQQGRVHGKQRRQFGLIGLELLPGGPDGRVFVCRILEFDHPERQAVDEQQHIGPALVLILNNRQLIDRQPVVIGMGVSKSITRACAPRTVPLSVRCSTVTPSTSIYGERRGCGLRALARPGGSAYEKRRPGLRAAGWG